MTGHVGAGLVLGDRCNSNGVYLHLVSDITEGLVFHILVPLPLNILLMVAMRLT